MQTRLWALFGLLALMSGIAAAQAQDLPPGYVSPSRPRRGSYLRPPWVFMRHPGQVNTCKGLYPHSISDSLSLNAFQQRSSRPLAQSAY